MPYFRWTGVDIVGTTKRGRQAAHSKQELSDQLFRHGIAVLCSKALYTPSFLWKISGQAKSDLFRHIAKLLKAGMLLPEVLEVTAQQSQNPFLYDMLFNLSLNIKSGMSFDVALEQQKTLCDSIVMTMLIAGHESGSLIGAAENAALYYKTEHLFVKNIRSVLAIPLLTLLFFVGICCFIFLFIIPRFAEMFSSLHHELPTITKYMIAISNFMCSWLMVPSVITMVIAAIVMRYYFSTIGKRKGVKIMMQLPFLGVLIRQYQFGQILHALSLLVKSGIPLVPALAIITDSIGNYIIKQQFHHVHEELLSGQMMSDAMLTSSLFLPEVCALVRIGEKSGTLGESLEDAAEMYTDTFQDAMRQFIFFLQPAVIILLGFLITALIFAVYLPIMQLSHVL